MCCLHASCEYDHVAGVVAAAKGIKQAAISAFQSFAQAAAPYNSR